MAKKIYPISIVIFFSVISIFPLFHNGLPPTHDGEYHIIRFYEFYKMLSSGNFYPRWAPDLNNGYGLPLFNYVYPFPNYFAAIAHIIGISFIDAFKLNMIVASIVGAIFFYLLVREFFETRGGVVASVFYTFSPYHFLDIYIRGSVGEVWALAFYPAVFWSLTKLFQKKSIFHVITSAFFIAATIFSHNILGLLLFPFMFSYIGFRICKTKKRKKLLFFSFVAILLGVGISAIFWFPALAEKSYVTGLEIYAIKDNFPELYQLLIPSWGSGFSQANPENFMSLQIGIGNLAIIMYVFITLLLYKKNRGIHKSIELFFLFWFFFVFFLMLKIAMPLWNNIPLMRYFQFPWRLLSIEIFTASFLAGSVVYKFRSRILTCIFITIVFFLGIGYVKPAYYHQRDDNYYISKSNFIDGTNSPGNYFNTIWMNRSLKKDAQKISIDKGYISTLQKKSTEYAFTAYAQVDSRIHVDTAYFPGWRVTVDGKQFEVANDPNGLIVFSVPKGIHKVHVSFADTPVRTLATFCSLFSCAMFFALILKIVNSKKKFMNFFKILLAI